ncbi:MAG: SLC45 family MFS transporter [Bacteroidales bacterium]|nr:SLC45 family MFS transporter [Bacteroidales bacterium]MBQ3440200.1 SLC45 family MFS transporter [Bacteroidales bacterium]MBR1795530.1 SLC45 family MFS transporter [Bacteroidales bacterium]
MSTKRNLTFRQMVDLSFGFFGVQIAYALQSANISRIFATLGADPHQLSWFWILPPLMGMIVQPLIGKWSDRTWTRMGRRKPYLIVGAVVAVLVMLFLPNAGSLHFSARLFLGLNMAMWFGLFSLIFLDTSINVAMQPFKMMVGDMVNEEQKTTAYSIQSFLCNAGSLVGYLFPIFFTWIGIANEAPEGVVPDSVIYSFYCGAAILILCVLYTFLRVKEMPPKEYAEFHGIDLQKQEEKSDKGLVRLLAEAPKTFWTVGLVQFFCWAAFLYMWTYTNGAVAENCWGVDMSAANAASSAGFQAAGNWVGVLFAVQAVGSILWAAVLPRFKSIKLAYVVSLLIGAAGFASVMFIHNQYVLFLSFFLIGFAWAAMLALPFTLLTNALEGSPYMGSYLGLFNCTICLPQIVAAATGGLVLKLLGNSQPAMLLAAGVFLVLGALSVRLIQTRK